MPRYWRRRAAPFIPEFLSDDRTGKRFKGLAMPERKMNPPVFLGSSAIIAALLIPGLAVPGQAEDLFSAIQSWAIYGVVGLSLAYFSFRYNLPLTIRSGLYPLLKDRINGPSGNAVDIFALCLPLSPWPRLPGRSGDARAGGRPGPGCRTAAAATIRWALPRIR
jgi:BCCT, betaine/carnitine/choline family transporter